MNCELKGFLLQDVLLLIGLKKWTGELVLESGNNIGSIIFHDGAILQAFSPYSRAIGDLLVEDGIITEAELLETLRQQKKRPASPIGDLFIKTGKINFEVIEMMVQQQIREAIKEFATWQKVRASFAEKDVRPFDRIHLPVHEFILPDTMKSAAHFCSPKRVPSTSSPSTASTPV